MTKNYKMLCVRFVFILMVMITGCRPVKETELYGTYVAKYPFGTEKLIINSNGEYNQKLNVIVDGKSNTLINKGRWKYNPIDKYLTLENALSAVDGFGKLKKDYDIPIKGYVVRPMSKLFPWSHITIEINPDCGYYFVKENGSNLVK